MSKDLAQAPGWNDVLARIERVAEVDASTELCDPPSRQADQRIAPHGDEVIPLPSSPCVNAGEQSDPTRGFCNCGHLLSEHGARGCRHCECVVGWELGGEQPTAAERLAELKAAIGYKDPHAAARASRQARALALEDEKEQARSRELARQVVREQLGDWTKDNQRRLEQMAPQTVREGTDAKRLGKRVWAIARQASQGSVADLAYAIQQMQTCAPVEAVGCWVVEAMGLQASGAALRQLHSTKARRKLVRSFVLWMSGENTRLRKVAGSPSRRTVRGVKRVPQNLLARIASVGGKPWHRSTTSRDATESHDAGLFRRVRMRRDLAHESERCGTSGQVVSRYWMELPRQPRRHGRKDLPDQLGAFFQGAGVANDELAWVREQAKHAIVYAMQTVTTIKHRLAELACIPGMLAPLLRTPP